MIERISNIKCLNNKYTYLNTYIEIPLQRVFDVRRDCYGNPSTIIMVDVRVVRFHFREYLATYAQ